MEGWKICIKLTKPSKYIAVNALKVPASRFKKFPGEDAPRPLHKLAPAALVFKPPPPPTSFS